MKKPYPFFASETYPLDPKDLAKLPDFSGKPEKGKDIVILLGNAKSGMPDTLYQGRAVIQKAIRDKKSYVPVHVAFHRNRPWYDVLAPFCKSYRKRFYQYGTNIYHIDPREIRRMGLERGRRTPETAYHFSKWKMTQDQRDRQYNELKQSLAQKGYDDAYPMDIMVCRSLGVQDALHQGHHRMMFCMEMGIKRASVRFMAVTHAPKFAAPFLKLFFKKKGKR